MRIYLNAESKNGIGYTPDTLIIELNGKEYEYDICASIDYDKPGLICRAKGELAKANEKSGDYVELEEKDYKEVIDLLKNPNSKITIAIYPDSEFEEMTEQLNTDEVNGDGTFEYMYDSIPFHFSTVFYGI